MKKICAVFLLLATFLITACGGGAGVTDPTLPLGGTSGSPTVEGTNPSTNAVTNGGGPVVTVPDTDFGRSEFPIRDPEQIDNNGYVSYTAGEGLLYNGIKLPDNWRTPADPDSDEVPVIPYLLEASEGGYHPDVVDITVGRQLFVDDFLIDSTNLKTVYHQAQKYTGSPVFKAKTVDEFSGGGAVGTSAGGIWYDMEEQKYKMWYDVGFNPKLGYAESEDGINWTRVNVDGTGSNIVLNKDQKDGTCSVFIDYSAPAEEKYKMLVQSLSGSKVSDPSLYEQLPGDADQNSYLHTLFVSPDGLHWVRKGEKSLGCSGDMTTAYYDSLRNKWINSLRGYSRTIYKGNYSTGRSRWYAEWDDFEDLLNWTAEDTTFWMKTDKLDQPDASAKVRPQVYNFSAIAYESIMLGSYTIWYGPENHIIAATGNPKKNEIQMAYSRDGYHYDRPDRTSFIGSGKDGDWDKGYLFSTIGGIIVHDDVLYIYYSGFSGYMGANKDAHAGQSIGLATLRRDGFASLQGKGSMTTRTMTANGNKKYLFVNINTPKDSFRAEVLDANGQVIEGFSMEDCIAVGGNDTCMQITWKNGKDLSFLNGTDFKLRFSMEEEGEFYSFWLSDSLRGESDGAVAAGYAGR